MHHEITLICDDIRHEVGNKVSLIGIYDEAILLDAIPGRLAKICMFQVWRAEKDVIQEAGKLTIEMRGDALNGALRVEARPPESERNKGILTGRLAIQFSPVEVLREGEIEFVTSTMNESRPLYIRKLRVGKKADTTA